jgi:hypothetical protein
MKMGMEGPLAPWAIGLAEELKRQGYTARCAFRRIRPPVPVDSGHLFRSKPARGWGDAGGCSTRSRTLRG